MQPGRHAEIAVPHDRTSAELRAQAAGLIGDERLEEAAALLADGRRTFPDDVQIRLDQASLAEAAGDWNGALELLQEVIDHAPETRAAYRRAGTLCRTVDRDREAEMILAEGMARFPDDLDILDAYAALAEARQDWTQAMRRTRLLCERFPSHRPASLRLAAALKRTNRIHDAERVLLQASERTPPDLSLLIDCAELAAERQDWIEAARRFDVATAAFPDNWWSCKRSADMLKRAGRIADAEAMLLDGQRRLPHEPILFTDQAELAADTHDQAEVLARFERTRERFPNFWWSWKRIADILRATGRTGEAEAVLLDGQQRFPEERGLFVDHAELVAGRQDWPGALRCFELLRDRFPDFWWSWKRIADIFRATGRTEEAEALLLDGQQRFPGEQALFIDQADLVAARQDWPDALRRFELVRQRFPESAWSWKRTADILRASGRPDEAETVLVDGQGRFPNEPILFIDYAELAADAKDRDETLRRFDLARTRFPDMWYPYRRLAETHRQLQRFDDAEAILLEGQRRLPGESLLFFDHADLAQLAGRQQDAFDRFQAIRERFPNDYWARIRLATACTAVGRPGDGEAMLIEAMQVAPEQPAALIELCRLTGRIPAEDRRIPLPELARMVADRILRDGETLELLDAGARLAQLGGDYPDYLRRLQRIGEAHPDAPGLPERIVAAREILLGIGEADSLEADEPAARSARSDDLPATTAELFALFESLGGGGPDGSGVYGCEFGFAQRKLEIEPLSLLRWTGVAPPNLIRLLECDFEGIGDPEFTNLVDIPTQNDWHAADTRYALYCAHTHLDRLTVPLARAQKMMSQRMSFLARKLREDLKEGGKVFVYRYMGTVEDESEMLALARAVNGFGRNVLLFVCRADKRHPPFTVRQVHPGLLVGHLDWFAQDRFVPATGYPANMEGWTRVCEAAYRLWRSPA